MISGYKAMVRPIIEYACPVWDPYQAYLSDKWESRVDVTIASLSNAV